ncbi:MAG: hypothetical protein ACRDQ9_08010 [Pseudonocardiaceae bacterium]
MTARKRPPRARTCPVCLGWGLLRDRLCSGCAAWARHRKDHQPCRRCRHGGLVNSDGLCRLCQRAVRAEDFGWLAAPTQRGCPTQLALILPGAPVTSAQPLTKRPGRPPRKRQLRPPVWVRRDRAAPGLRQDDPRVCPPVAPGQRALFPPVRRILTTDHARRIKDRDIPGYQQVRDQAARHATEHSYSITWLPRICLMLRLALALRDADGDDLVREETLDDLPAYTKPTAELLHQCGLLHPRHDAGQPSPQGRRSFRPPAFNRWAARGPRSCRHCGSWGLSTLCQPCQRWINHPVGTCRRCGHPDTPVFEGLCRACRVHVNNHGPHSLTGTGTQLQLDYPSPRATRATGPHRNRRDQQTDHPPRPEVSPHLLTPDQHELFTPRRDWGRLDLRALPPLTPAARTLLEEFDKQAKEQQWDAGIHTQTHRTLRILLSRLGTQSPIPEPDIRSIPAHIPGTSSERVVRFLHAHGLLIAADPAPADVDEQAILDRLHTLPEPIAAEMLRWVRVLRGQGLHRHRQMPFGTIRRYLGYLHPIVQTWTQHVSSLREISAADIHTVLTALKGSPARSTHTALGSLFRALKQERLIFRNPTRGISLPTNHRLPVPLPPQQLRGLLDQANSPLIRFMVALVSIHAPHPADLRNARLNDLDLARGRLTIPRPTGHHVTYLDELTTELAITYLTERNQRWPRTTNPHLFISQQTASDPQSPPTTRGFTDLHFRRLGISATQLRTDRLLDEARHTADPVHLMRLFSISEGTAMRYLHAAHPERQTVIPR